MIDLGNITGLHERQHELHAYCPTCDRWRVLPLATMIAAGLGERRLQVRPPIPVRSASGWIAPRGAECRENPRPVVQR